MTIAMVLVGLCAMVPGVFAYRGSWRNWAIRSGFTHNLGFSLVYIGAGFATIGGLLAFPLNTFPTNLIIAIWVLLCGIGIIGFFWLPSFMLPRWFIAGRDERRDIERAAADLRRTARAMKKAKRKP